MPTAEDTFWHQVVVRLLDQRDVCEEEAKEHLLLLEKLAFRHRYRFCTKELMRAFAEETATWLTEEKKFANPREQAQLWPRDLEE